MKSFGELNREARRAAGGRHWTEVAARLDAKKKQKRKRKKRK